MSSCAEVGGGGDPGDRVIDGVEVLRVDSARSAGPAQQPGPSHDVGDLTLGPPSLVPADRLLRGHGPTGLPPCTLDHRQLTSLQGAHYSVVPHVGHRPDRTSGQGQSRRAIGDGHAGGEHFRTCQAVHNGRFVSATDRGFRAVIPSC